MRLTCSEALAVIVANQPVLPAAPARLRDAAAAVTAAGLDMPTLLFAIAYRESSFDPNAVNGASSAMGLFQLLAGTADDIEDRVVKTFLPPNTTIPGLTGRLRESRKVAKASAFAANAYLLDRIAWAGNDVPAGIAKYGTGAQYAAAVVSAVNAVRRTCGLPEGSPTDLAALTQTATQKCAALTAAMGAAMTAGAV